MITQQGNNLLRSTEIQRIQNSRVKNQPEMADCSCSDQRQDNVIVLLSLKSINCCYFARPTNQWIVATTLSDDVTNQMFLTIICRKNSDLIRGVTKQPQVHEQANTILCFRQILIEIRIRLRFSNSLQRKKVK